MPRALGRALVPWAASDVVSPLAVAQTISFAAYLVHDTDDEPLLLDLVRLDRVLILEDFACGAGSDRVVGTQSMLRAGCVPE